MISLLDPRFSKLINTLKQPVFEANCQTPALIRVAAQFETIMTLVNICQMAVARQCVERLLPRAIFFRERKNNQFQLKNYQLNDRRNKSTFFILLKYLMIAIIKVLS